VVLARRRALRDSGTGRGYARDVNVEPYPTPAGSIADPRFMTAWFALRRRRWISIMGIFSWFLGGIVAMSMGWTVWTMLPIGAFLLWSGPRVQHFRCPFCKDMFFGGSWLFPNRKLSALFFGRQCKSCGVEIRPTKGVR
jgi:hypothetical protein